MSLYTATQTVSTPESSGSGLPHLWEIVVTETVQPTVIVEAGDRDEAFDRYRAADHESKAARTLHFEIDSVEQIEEA